MIPRVASNSFISCTLPQYQLQNVLISGRVGAWSVINMAPFRTELGCSEPDAKPRIYLGLAWQWDSVRALTDLQRLSRHGLVLRQHDICVGRVLQFRLAGWVSALRPLHEMSVHTTDWRAALSL